tara:strand:+ start:5552 stop:5791 length:240 start_codon:yes stop_codon:yes gene_type:complete
MVDLTYTTDGIFYTIMPETEDGENAWRKMAEMNGGNAKFFAHEFPSVKAQLKQAGYKIRKDTKKKMSIDEIMAELDEII